jgi:hypothetical protein
VGQQQVQVVAARLGARAVAEQLVLGGIDLSGLAIRAKRRPGEAAFLERFFHQALPANVFGRTFAVSRRRTGELPRRDVAFTASSRSHPW